MADPELSPADPAPRMRPDLRVHKTATADGAVYEVEDPTAGKRYPLRDFELSIARMLNGQRSVAQVLANASDIGIPVSLPSFQGFIRKLRSAGLLASSDSAPGAAMEVKAGTTWEVRQEWPEPVRLQFQNALKAYRSDRFADAKKHLQMLLAVQPQTPDAVDMLRYIEEQLSKDPRADKAPSFIDMYNAAERTWFQDGEAGRSVSGEEEVPIPQIQSGGKKVLFVLGAVLLLGAVGLAIPLPYTVSTRCQLEARAKYEVKVSRAGVVAENVVADGKWVEKGAVLARLDGSEPKKKLEANASRTAELQARARKPSPAAKKAAAAQAKQARADAELRKAVEKFEALVAKAKKKRTAKVVKAEKKLAALKTAATRAAKGAEAAAAASGAKALQAELAKLAEEKKALEDELASLDIVAPEAGFLSGSARVKQTLAAGAVFGRLEDTKVLKAVAFFAEGDREFIKVDQPLALTLPKGKELQTKVSSIGESAREIPGTPGLSYEVSGMLENADAALKPGTAGTAKLEGGKRSLFGRVF